jgi:hypothetical protein
MGRRLDYRDEGRRAGRFSRWLHSIGAVQLPHPLELDTIRQHVAEVNGRREDDDAVQ